MKLFPYGHATHPQWQMAAGLVLAQVRAQMALPEYASSPTLALLYITDHYASSAQDILEHLSAELPEITEGDAVHAGAVRGGIIPLGAHLRHRGGGRSGQSGRIPG